MHHSGDGFTFNITTAGDAPLYVEGSGQGEDARTRAACMVILGVMPSEGLEEAVDTLKDMYQFYACPPDRVLPAPIVFEMNAVVTSAK